MSIREKSGFILSREDGEWLVEASMDNMSINIGDSIRLHICDVNAFIRL